MASLADPLSNGLVPARALEPGATIGLFSPAEPLIPERLSTLRSSLQILADHGFSVAWAPNAQAQGPYSAGDVETRLADIHTLLADDEVAALFGTWGGKSCNQLLPALDYDLISTVRKPIIGFSDVAVLLNAITTITGLVTFHFLVAGRLPETKHADLAMITGEGSTSADVFDFHAKDTPRHVLRPGAAIGRLFGGNLSTFALGLLGTQFLPTAADIIFFWESAGERPMVVDQNLTALRNAGFFDRVRAMIIGSVYTAHDLHVRDISHIVHHAVRDYSFPILYSPTFGHLPTRNPVVPIGARCSVSSDAFTVALLEDNIVLSYH